MGGFVGQYKDFLCTLSPNGMVHLSSRSRYARRMLPIQNRNTLLNLKNALRISKLNSKPQYINVI